MESALDKILRPKYIFNAIQTCFCPSSGCGHALLHTAAAIEDGHQFIAVLDLKKAFDKASRHIIARLIKRILPSLLATWIMYFLQPTFIVTPDDEQDLHSIRTLGVPQGSPLLPPPTTFLWMY